MVGELTIIWGPGTKQNHRSTMLRIYIAGEENINAEGGPLNLLIFTEKNILDPKPWPHPLSKIFHQMLKPWKQKKPIWVPKVAGVSNNTVEAWTTVALMVGLRRRATVFSCNPGAMQMGRGTGSSGTGRVLGFGGRTRSGRTLERSQWMVWPSDRWPSSSVSRNMPGQQVMGIRIRLWRPSTLECLSLQRRRVTCCCFGWACKLGGFSSGSVVMMAVLASSIWFVPSLRFSLLGFVHLLSWGEERTVATVFQRNKDRDESFASIG